MHRHDTATEVLTQAVIRYAVERVRLDPAPLDGPRSEAELQAMVGDTITARGIGGLEALRIFGDVLAPACISVDHPRFLSFVPTAPTEAAVLFDLVVGASSVYGGSWLEGAGCVFAENQALRWIADLVGFPPEAGGVFVSGGTNGNLSALVAARHRWRSADPVTRERLRPIVVTSSGAHSSVKQAARVMDADVLMVAADRHGRLTRELLEAALGECAEPERICAIVATCGTTNAGVIDDLRAVGDACAWLGAWFHVDGAYGGAGLCAPSVRDRYVGIERADSFIVDPHKWLFAPYDCCALLYRDPSVGRAAHIQHAEYLDVLTGAPEWNPSDYGHQLTRRVRGLPFWFSLATYGTDAYREAVETGLALARSAARLIEAEPVLELLAEPELSVVLFRRVGWSAAEYDEWSDRMLATGEAFVVPTSWQGETVLRFCFVNPRTTVDDIEAILATLA